MRLRDRGKRYNSSSAYGVRSGGTYRGAGAYIMKWFALQGPTAGEVMATEISASSAAAAWLRAETLKPYPAFRVLSVRLVERVEPVPKPDPRQRAYIMRWVVVRGPNAGVEHSQQILAPNSSAAWMKAARLKRLPAYRVLSAKSAGRARE